MAKICWFNGTPPPLLLHSQLRTLPLQQLRRNHGVQYKHCAIYNRERETTETPVVLKIAVSGVTELLRLFSPSQQTIVLSGGIEKQNNDNELPISSVDDVLMIIKSDYDNAYFVTGNFTSSIYAENCIFEDPTIKFRGRELYARNLKLLVPFFDCASIRLLKIEKDVDSDTNFLRASWKLRTNLKLPWRPLIAIDGRTFYELNEDFKVRIKRLLGTSRVGMFLHWKQFCRFSLLSLKNQMVECHEVLHSQVTLCWHLLSHADIIKSNMFSWKH